MKDGANLATADAATPEANDDPFAAIDTTMSAAYDRAMSAGDGGDAQPEAQAEAGNEELVAEPAAGDETTEQQDQTQTAEGAEPLAAVIDPPTSWSAEMKAKWAELPPDVQAYASQREMEAHKRISELGQTVKQTEPIRNVVDHYQDVFRANNVAPDRGIALLLEAQKRLDTDPVSAIHEIAAAYGVDLSAATPGAENASPENETVRSLRAEIASLKRDMGETRNQVLARERSEQERQQATLATLVSDFAKDKDDFTDIEQDMIGHVAAIRQAEPDLEPKLLLEKAYEAARWANPATRARLLEKQISEAEAKRAEDARKKAAEAKKAASINVKSKGGNPGPSKGTWEDTLNEAADRAFSA